MFNFINIITKEYKDEGRNPIRNFCGVIENMNRKFLSIETDIFNNDILEFYTKHNMGLLDKNKDYQKYEKYYNEMRGGEMGDYSYKFQDKLANVVDALKKFPKSKRAIITMPYSRKTSDQVKHSNDSENKCLRELQFFIEDDYLHCTGFMRAQASIIFPKNIHFIGEVFNQIADEINVPIGTYTHFVTTLVYDRE
jgi:thymidylate synthase